MNLNIRYLLDKTYQQGTPDRVIKDHLYYRRTKPKYMLRDPQTVYLWVSARGSHFKLNTGFRIPPVEWDFNKRRPKPSYEHASLVDARLTQIKSEVEQRLLEAQLKKPTLSFEEVKRIAHEAMDGQRPKRRDLSFFTAFDKFLRERKAEVKENTLKKYRSLRKVLAEYADKRGRKLTFDGVDQDFFRDFRAFLTHEKQLVNDSQSKYVDALKSWMRWAVDKEYTDNTEFERFKVEKSRAEVVYLSEAEIDAIWALELHHRPELERTRDLFIFQIYTGQRFGDVRGLRLSEVHQNGKGREWHLFQRKGNKKNAIQIPLPERADALIQKYEQCSEDPAKPLFPKVSNQKANRGIKKICELAGITEEIQEVKYSGKRRIERVQRKCDLVSSHTARRTFVTLSLRKGVKPESIMAITGHTSYDVMKRYLNVDNAFAKEELSRAW
ncbi:MAG: phage integrase SAM-like domain-containing protein [Flavobacteriales bacterium]